MIVSKLKDYIKEKKSVSMTQIILDLDTTPEEIEGPLSLLLEKHYIVKESLEPGETPKGKCASCPMDCPGDRLKGCGPGSNSITVYSWSRY